MQIEKGDFVKVGNDIGVIVFLEYENHIPEEHFGIWFGEKTPNNLPKYKTVPIEYCIKISDTKNYH